MSLRILFVMPEIQESQTVADSVSKILENEVEVRFNYEQATKNHHLYDVFVIYMIAKVDESDILKLQDRIGDKIIIPIIVGERGDAMSQKMYSNGIYNGLYQSDADCNAIANICKTHRMRSEAKHYYGVETVLEHLSQLKIQKIVESLKVSANKPELFDEMSRQLTSEQNVVLVSYIKKSESELSAELSGSSAFSNYDPTVSLKPVEVIEKQVSVSTVVEKTKVQTIKTSVRNKLYCILGSSEFAAEFATMLSNNNHRTLLIDVDPIAPSAHNVLGIEGVNDGVSVGNISSSSFLQAYEACACKKVNHDLINVLSCKVNDKFHCLGGELTEDMSDILNHEVFKRLIDISQDIYDVVVVSAPFDFYYSLTLYMVTKPMVTTLIPFEGTALGIKAKIIPIRHVEKHHAIDVKYIAYDYQDVHLDKSALNEILESKYIGSISYEPSRVKKRNDFKKSLVIQKSNLKEYEKILLKLEIPLNKRKGFLGRKR